MTSNRRDNNYNFNRTGFLFYISEKNLLLSIVVGFLLFSIVNPCKAQNNISTSLAPANNPAYKIQTDSVNALVQAKTETQKMQTQYHLNAQQTSEVQDINFTYYFQLNQVYSSVTNTTNIPTNQINQIKSNYYSALSAVLNANQLQQIKSEQN